MPHAFEEYREGPGERVLRGRRRRDGRRSGRGRLAVGPQPEVARPVAHEQGHEQADAQEREARGGERHPPTGDLLDPSPERQEGQLSGRRARRQQAEHEAAPLGEPAVGDERAEHERRHAAADAEEEAPEDDELPELRHERRERDRREQGGDRA